MTMTITLAGSGYGLRFLAGSGFNEYGSETLCKTTGNLNNNKNLKAQVLFIWGDLSGRDIYIQIYNRYTDNGL